MKTLLKIVLVLIILVVVGLGVAIYQIDAIAKKAVEKGGTYALGVETTVDSISIGFLSGKLGMQGLTLANPDGYPTEKMLKTGTFDFQLDTSTVQQDEVIIELISLDGLNMRLDKKDGKYNMQVVADNVKRFGKGEAGEETTTEPAEPAPDAGPGKVFTVKELVVKDITVHVDGVPGSPFTVDEVRLPNVGSNMTLDELIARLYPLIMSNVLKSIAALPAELVANLTADLAGAAEALGGEVTKLLDDSLANTGQLLQDVGGEALQGAGEVIDGVGGEAGKAVEDITRDLGGEAGKAAEGVGDAIKGIGGGLFGGDKKDE